MRAQLSWLTELVPALAGKSGEQVADLFVSAGIEVDQIITAGPDDVDGLSVGEVVDIEELTEFKKPIRFCHLRVRAEGTATADEPEIRDIVCGAQNFSVGDRVVVALPGAVLPGDFRIAARKTYGKTSDGMICSSRELGIGDDHDGILVLPADAPIGANAVDYLGLHDVIFVTEPTPDRGYQLSVRGLARELAAKLDAPFTDPADVPAPPAGQGFPVTIEDDACGSFAARVLRGFDPSAPSPMWMRTRLLASGMRPISLAVDVTNYVMLLIGQPMHAYDLDRLAGQIVVRRAAEGESIVTIDDVKRELLAGEDLLITDGEHLHGIAGVMGAEAGEINAGTTDILLEAAYFDPVTISRSVRRHHLLSEAGRRFERGVDPVTGPVAIALASDLLSKYGGAQPEQHITLAGQPGLPAPQQIDPARINKLVGVDYDLQTVTRTLSLVGCTVEQAGELLRVTPPTWRPDLLEMPDFAEEVARIDGYDNVPVILPAAKPGTGLTAEQRARRQVSRAVAYSGFVETPSMSFHDEAALDALRIPADDVRRRLVQMANPIAADQTALRSTLLPGLFAALVRNHGRGFEDVALYETGTVFREPDGAPRPPAPPLDVAVVPTEQQFADLAASMPIERAHLAVAIAGKSQRATWSQPSRDVGWQDAVGAVQTAADALGAQIVLAQADVAPWHPGRCASVSLTDGTLIGYAGEIHPAVCEALDLPRRTCAAEIDLGALIARRFEGHTAPQVSTFPPATQDIALVVDAALPAADVQAVIENAAGPLLESVRLFDVFTGDQVGEGKKSLAYALTFRAVDRTLDSEETTDLRAAVITAATDRLGAVLR
ncbi:phenylalanyl-tRNA synthetase beta subunit [Antricoccus suffuscus]|uniref:Phenylalanine--tRNA ligase beta subunit n=1 Tax=Antricoccus suffuscus TaxID=1629062 RepID=A0A2T0ZWE3_9ACTN|nr:phenylalanine--tRNA ligase subunit beta [Antricoccus suffuscus]PRZ40681.1 phenylalanyl-tRNA synthetase beta subunit [Antricoccus suffuscus]